MSTSSCDRNAPAFAGPGGNSRFASILSRRHAIGADFGTVAGATMVRHAAAAGTPLRAVVTVDGQNFEHREDSGRDLGNFVSVIGGFTQRCIRADVAGSPLTVLFRPDVDSDRAEVVFEHGSAFTKNPVNLGAYSVTIYRGETQLATIAVPAHYHLSRWRWQSAIRPVVAKIDQLIAQGLLPPYDRSAVPGATPVSPATPTLGPTPEVQVPDASNAPPPEEAFTVNPGVAVPYEPPQSLIDYLRAMFGSTYWLLSTGDRKPGLLESAAIGTAVGALAAKAFQMSSAQGAEVQIAEVPRADAPILKTALASSVYTYTPMSLAGVTAYMPQTGERDDIGLLTEHQARYVCTESADALEIVRAWGEAAGTVPWHMRDDTTNAPLDFRTYPRASWYWDQRVADPWVVTTTTPITPDAAHLPALSYLPYVLTGDPYHLEEMQFTATWTWGANPPNYRPQITQSRSFAWSMRNLAQTARMTPANVPSWLLPQSYWLDMLEKNRQFLENAYVNNPKPQFAVFRSTGDIDNGRDEALAPAGTWVDPWQEEFVAAVIGWIIDMGFTNWKTAFDWKIGSTIARTGTSSGWVRAQATPYRVILRSVRNGSVVGAWTEAWSLSAQIAKLTYASADTWVGTDLTYLGYSRGALVYAAKHGAQVGENLSWATGQINAKGWKSPYKWRLGDGLR